MVTLSKKNTTNPQYDCNMIYNLELLISKLYLILVLNGIPVYLFILHIHRKLLLKENTCYKANICTQLTLYVLQTIVILHAINYNCFKLYMKE